MPFIAELWAPLAKGEHSNYQFSATFLDEFRSSSSDIRFDQSPQASFEHQCPLISLSRGPHLWRAKAGKRPPRIGPETNHKYTPKSITTGPRCQLLIDLIHSPVAWELSLLRVLVVQIEDGCLSMLQVFVQIGTAYCHIRFP